MHLTDGLANLELDLQVVDETAVGLQDPRGHASFFCQFEDEFFVELIEALVDVDGPPSHKQIIESGGFEVDG